MKLIITDSIAKTEYEPLEDNFSTEIIKSAARKSLLGLGDRLKSSLKIPATSLSKIYLTGSGAAGRAIFLLQINKEKAVLVMIRTKKDKQIGTNMTIKNPKFQRALDKNLNSIMSDLAHGRYNEYDL